jgi:hypothetical protein
VLGRFYFLRQAATLLKFASETKDRELAALLVERAADLKIKIEEAHERRNTDLSPAAPDVEA